MDLVELIRYDEQRVLVLAPHADDETIGCGGLIQKFVQNGSLVRVVIASFVRGVSRRFNKDLEVYKPYRGEDRYVELKGAMAVLGVSDFTVLYHEDDVNVQYHSLLDTRPRIELVTAIEDELRDFHPTVILIPSRTKHQDHSSIHDAAVTAARPYFWQGSVLVYETDGEMEFEPNLYVSLSKEMFVNKLKALARYRTQMSLYPHPVSERALTAKAEFRGQHIYTTYAEAFQVLRIYA
ncbi:PIG-L family deacetylase [Alicyclobacillus curvatus]|nr:PIG-L family deacetylase [Alicyclobacillus curvatus]